MSKVLKVVENILMQIKSKCVMSLPLTYFELTQKSEEIILQNLEINIQLSKEVAQIIHKPKFSPLSLLFHF